MSHRSARLTISAAATVAAFLLTIPPMFAQTPIRVSTYGVTFAPTGRSSPGEIVGKSRRFHGQAGEQVVFKAYLNMPPGSSGVQKMQRLIVRFRSTQAYLSNVEVRGPSAFRLPTRLEGDHMGEVVKPESIANTWVWRDPISVDAHSTILLEVQFAGGFEGNRAYKEFLVASVDAEFPGKPLARSTPATTVNSGPASRATVPSPTPGGAATSVIAPVAAKAIIYAVTANNDLMWYGHTGWEAGSFTWASPAGQKIGSGWDFKQVFPGDNGVIYGITTGGDLMWYRHMGRLDGSFRWTSMKKVGSGWNYDHVFSGGNGVIYAVTSTGDLMWFRHNGRDQGTDDWAPAPPAGRRVGSGWACKHVFAGGGGVIYAVMPNNDLMWYRHDGWGDGTFRWAKSAGQKIASNWDFKNVFSSGDGVIYAITPRNELFWFRHEGYGDGTATWVDTKSRGVGSGWAFKEVFSGATLAP